METILVQVGKTKKNKKIKRRRKSRKSIAKPIEINGRESVRSRGKSTIPMASLNATDANMPVALESFDECANNPNEDSQMATDDNEKASVEENENRVANDTLIDALDDNGNDHSGSHKTIEHIKGMIANDQTPSERSQHHSVSKEHSTHFCNSPTNPSN